MHVYIRVSRSRRTSSIVAPPGDIKNCRTAHSHLAIPTNRSPLELRDSREALAPVQGYGFSAGLDMGD